MKDHPKSPKSPRRKSLKKTKRGCRVLSPSTRYKRITRAHTKRWPGECMTVDEYTDLVRSKKCSYCTGPLPRAGHGVDRKDSRCGYVRDNCVSCCSHCNSLKGRLPHWLYVRVWAALVERYPHLATRKDPWADRKLKWITGVNLRPKKTKTEE